MRYERFIFLTIIGAVLLQGKSLARRSNSAPQQSPSQSRETSDSSGGQKNGQIRSEKNETGAGDSDVGQNRPERGTRLVTQRRPSQSHAKPAPSYQLHSAKTPAAGSLRPETPENGMGVHLTGSTTSSGVPNKAVSHRTVSAPPATVAVNGQQFKNSRDPGARLASSGGPLTAARGTAAINGTNMKRKP